MIIMLTIIVSCVNIYWLEILSVFFCCPLFWDMALYLKHATYSKNIRKIKKLQIIKSFYIRNVNYFLVKITPMSKINS